jgi:hypothetical protein
MPTPVVDGARTAVSSPELGRPPGWEPTDPQTCSRCGAESGADSAAAHTGGYERHAPVEMRLQASTGPTPRRHNLRFVTVSLFPTALLSLFGLALVASGASRGAPDLDRLWAAIGRMDGARLISLGLLIFVAAVLTHPFQAQLLKLFEGYWTGLPGLVRIGVAPHLRRHRHLEATLEGEPRTPDERRHWQQAARRLEFYPDEDRLLPTRLGNVLRAAEDHAGQRYGLDTVTVWPWLYPHVAGPLAQALAETRTQLDMHVRLCAMLLLAALVSMVTLLGDGAWLAVPAAAAALAWVAYQAAIRTAVMYGRGIHVAFDLYRFEMLLGMHLPLPGTLEEELEFNEQLCRFLESGLPLFDNDAQHRYEHVMRTPAGLAGTYPT